MKGDKRRWLRGAIIGLGAGIVAVWASLLPLVENSENRSYDLRTRIFADQKRADQDIVAVVVDQQSLDVLAKPQKEGGLDQGWPWPRDFHALLVQYLIYSGARAIVFDFVFSEKSIYTKHDITDDDAQFARASQGHPVVQSIVLTKEPLAFADRAWPPALREAPLTRRVSPPPTRNDKATPPIPPLLRSAAAVGSIGFEPDDDGIARTIRPLVAYAPIGSPEALQVWALPFAAALVLGSEVNLEGQGAYRTLNVNGRTVHLDEDGRMVLRFHGGEGTYRQFGYHEVLRSALRVKEGQAPTDAAQPEHFRRKIVIVGATAAGLLDLRATPMGAVLPGYVIHATALDNVLQGDPISRVTTRTRAGTVLTLAVACGALAALRSARLGFSAVAGIAIVYVGLAVWLFGTRGVWIDLVGPSLGIVFAWGGATGYSYFTEGRERRFLRDAFSRYLAPDVVATLVNQPGRLALGGEKRELTVMFADVAGFTTLSEGRDPTEVVTLMNEVFEQLTGVIQAEGGTVDKFIGDAVMAFWNAPVAQSDHPARAMRAGRELLFAVARVNASWASRGLPKLGMRVGIATGPAVVGNVGSKTKFNYTVMGDTVNLASRLEGAAKQYGATSMVADSTVAVAAGAVPTRELDRIAVKGRGEAVAVFELVQDDTAFAHAEALRAYAKGLEAYRARAFEEAAQQFEAALALVPDDGPSHEMRERCHEMIANPPPADWRGDYHLTSK
ncbi:MAG TPA: adenylate/guanylate cyclase domain-containing protein [Methylomirabilota bacterium]|nr:adenylate/guanylate cyclase domain-containing protein [Methylomirabilota bacterium]